MKKHGARVIITGAAGGLGLQTAERLTNEGAMVVGLDKYMPDEQLWKGKEFIQCDVTCDQEIEKAVNRAVEVLGGVDIVINNAGVLSLQDASIVPTKDSKYCFDVNFWGVWQVTAKTMPHLIKSSGKLINVSSLFGYVNAPLIPAYCTSKRAVAAFSDAIRMQYGKQITVTTIYPGYINTNIHQEAVRQGLSVGKIVDIRLFGLKLLNLEESLSSAAKGVTKACKGNYRNMGTTKMGTLTLWFARHFPALVDFVISTRVGLMIKKGSLNIQLDKPNFG